VKDESEHYSEEYLRAVELEVEAARLNSVGSLSPLHCVLGQVYGLYTTGLKALKMGYWGAPIHYGFCPRAMVEALILEDLWRAHIKIRRDLAAFAAM